LTPPLTVWRIVRPKRAAAAFDGEGARLLGGRWNRAGTRLVYTSTSLALATLELLVHVAPEEAPDDLVSMSAELPEGVAIATRAAASLPAGWREYPAPDSTQRLGSAWAAKGEEVALAVPSAVVPSEWNVLLNPLHSDFARLRIGRPQAFLLDPRLSRGRAHARVRRRRS
jgi:RES domain-containing protein